MLRVANVNEMEVVLKIGHMAWQLAEAEDTERLPWIEFV